VSIREEQNSSKDETDFPRNWRWDDDGDEIAGTFLEIDEGPTAYGTKPILILEVEGEPRSVWLLETAIQSRFADEVAKRPSRDLTVGERIHIRRGDIVTSGTGRDYRAFKVRFPDRPKRKATEILGKPAGESPEADEEPNEDDELPF
jgi:hypothetical protein